MRRNRNEHKPGDRTVSKGHALWTFYGYKEYRAIRLDEIIKPGMSVLEGKLALVDAVLRRGQGQE